MSEEKELQKHERLRRKRSRILYEITALIVVVLLASGLATFFLVRASQNRLINKSKDKLIQTEAENISSSFDYIINLLTPVIMEKALSIGIQDYAKAFAQGRVTETQDFVNQKIGAIVESGTLGISYTLLIIAKWDVFTTSFLFASSEPDLVYNWDVPEYLSKAINEGTSYILMEDGIPELGLKGEQLIIIRKIEDPVMDYVVGFVGVKPMGEEIAAIDEFYNTEKKDISIILGLVIIGSILVVILLIFFVLNYLIKKQITEPMDELATAAEQVMEGNLDVEIEIREGEEFEGLKLAFKEMVESIRKYISRSVGEDQ